MINDQLLMAHESTAPHVLCIEDAVYTPQVRAAGRGVVGVRFCRRGLSMPVFEATLQRLAAPRLSECGYAYDDRLRAGNELSGFRKPLGDDLHAIVQFQRRGITTQPFTLSPPSPAARYPRRGRRAEQLRCDGEFTINLLRVKSAVIEPHVYGGYSGSLGARLSHVLWFVENVRAKGGRPDRWWTLDDLEAVLEALLRYGLPWLENPQASKPWEMPAQRWREFVAAVTASIAPALEAHGYRAAAQSLAGSFPYPYFVKPLPGSEFALIEFQSIYSLDPAQFTFDVRLQRKDTDNPLDFSGPYNNWPVGAASLGQLVWRARAQPPAEAWSVDAVKSLLWRYADRVELDDRLGEVLTAIEQIAQPWLEGNQRHAGWNHQ
jgi:hypothetical protein